MDQTLLRSVTAHFVSPVVPDKDADCLVASLEQSFDIPVRRTSFNHEPPAAGLSEIAAIVGIVAGAGQIGVWVYQLSGMTEAGNEFRRAVRRLLESSHTSRESGRRYVPLAVEAGTNLEHPSVRFYFHGERTDDEIAEQLREAASILEELPPEALSASPGPQEYGFFWDGHTQQWRGRVFALEESSNLETTWWPPDLKIG